MPLGIYHKMTWYQFQFLYRVHHIVVRWFLFNLTIMIKQIFRTEQLRLKKKNYGVVFYRQSVINYNRLRIHFVQYWILTNDKSFNKSKLC